MTSRPDKILPEIKKDLKLFLLSEEGKIVEKNAAKLGLSVLALGGLLSGVMKPTDVQAQTSCHGSHAAHAAHASHGSHSNHSRGGWC